MKIEMNLLWYVSLLCILAYCYGQNDAWFFEMRRGKCIGEKLANRDVVKPGTPNTIKTTTFTWNGQNYKINCVAILNNMDISNGASARITQGGVGYSDVVIEMQTQLGQAMNFHLEVYGEPIRNGYRPNSL